MRLQWPGILAMLSALVTTAAPLQSTRVEALGAGRLLVASKDLKDPNFAKTVVLLVNYDSEGVMGVIINRRSTVPLSQVFEDVKEANDHPDPVYAGGPVEKTSALALLRSRAKPKDAEHVFADINLVADEDLLRKALSSGAKSSEFRIYLGYAGWAVSQLEKEVEIGAWYVFPADAGAVFDPNPDTLWSRMIRKTEDRVAQGPIPMRLGLASLVPAR
jgi:putative transcriptional regulator